MSLTSHLDNPQSPVSQFLRTHFPHLRSVQAQFRAGLAGKPTIRPVGPVPWGTIGHAFDYRLRYSFEVTPSNKLVAFLGMRKASEGTSGFRIGQDAVEAMGEPPWPHLGSSFFTSLDQTITRIDPARRHLAPEDERTLNRYCVVLGWFEEIYRAGLERSPLLQLPKEARAEDALALVESSWIDDLGALSEVFYLAMGNLLDHPTVLNPIFAGSRDVHGADADLIVDDCLIDVKTTVNPSLDMKSLYQVIGYTLLDYVDAYRVGRVGFYFARQGTLITWPVDELLATVSGGKRQDLGAWRAAFRENIRATRLSRFPPPNVDGEPARSVGVLVDLGDTNRRGGMVT